MKKYNVEIFYEGGLDVTTAAEQTAAVVSRALREHDGALWLHADELNSVSFLNADVEVVKLIQGAGR